MPLADSMAMCVLGGQADFMIKEGFTDQFYW
jgi:hypothetical protein